MSTGSVARVALVNLGCRVNRAEIDGFAIGFEAAGCAIVDDVEQAELIVVNTCAVTGEAQTKTRKAVRRMARLPQSPIVIATGCAATLFSEELVDACPGACVIPNKHDVVRRGMSLLGMDASQSAGAACEVLTPTPTGRTRPSVKIQDGCDNRCTYCIVWKARGRSRSVPAAHVVREVRQCLARGAHEVVLTGINLGCWIAPDADLLPEGSRLHDLIELLMRETTVERLRISSIEPPDVTDELLDVMAGSAGRVAPFLHVCLQSGCDETLARMGRVYDTDQFRHIVRKARDRMPGVAVGTDVIAGFPGETDEEFGASYAFCEEMAFARMHVFRYSPRPGTPAAIAPAQVDAPTSSARARRLRMLSQRMRSEAASAHDGERDVVLVQSKGRAVSSHLFDVMVDESLPIGSLVEVRLSSIDGSLFGLHFTDRPSGRPGSYRGQRGARVRREGDAV